MEIKNTAADREEWKKRVNNRIEHLKLFEKQKGHHHKMNLGKERIEERNHQVEINETFRCTKKGATRCAFRGGLAIHRKRMHRENPDISFECLRCKLKFKTENTMRNHFKTCTGTVTEDSNKRACNKCNKTISKFNIARPRTACRGA